MKRYILAFAALVTAAATPWAQGSRNVIISFKPGTSLFAQQQALAAMGVKPLKNIASVDQARTFIAVVAQKKSAAATLRSTSSSVLSVENDTRIKWIEDAPSPLAATPFPAGAALNDLGLKPLSLGADVKKASLTMNQEMRNRVTWNIQRVNAPAAWNYTQGDGVQVAVIDTGIDFTHPALKANVVGGYNAITSETDPQSYKDDNGHGTHVSGIIAGDGPRLSGVAPHAKLYAIKVLDATGTGAISDIVNGIVWVVDHHIPVANMSLGSPQPSPAMEEATMYAAYEGTVIVAAAGNSEGGPVSYPGAYPYTIAISASDFKNHLAPFSSVGPQVAFIAPGQDIVSSWLNGGYNNISGTSMAAPHVTGLVALSLSQGYLGLGGPDGVVAQLKKAATPLPGISKNGQGNGIVDALKLVQ